MYTYLSNYHARPEKSEIFICFVMMIYLSFPSYSNASLVAFPGAEGYGAGAVGGRGGKVIKVTNLNSSGTGSLQAACEAKGPRIVVFEVGGVIRGDVKIRHPFITIAGQTAPSPGITVAGKLLARPEDESHLHDIIIRFIRFRPPRTKGHTGDAVQLPKTDRIILDHLSLSWANDETVDICKTSNVTIQWCTLEESDTEGHDKGRHNFGLISAYPESGNVSIHHNIFAHHSSRSPSLSPAIANKSGDFRNNVIYNFFKGLTHDGHVPYGPINLIANYYKKGPDSLIIIPFEFHRDGKYYVKDNYIDGVGEFDNLLDDDKDLPHWIRQSKKGTILKEPAKVAPVKTNSAIESFRIVTKQAGCLPRDRVTKRTIKEILEGTGKWGRNAPSNPTDEWFSEGLDIDKAPLDSDDDGIPDYWESKNGLNKSDARDYNRIMNSGYSAIEEYINDRADMLIRKSMQE